MNADWTMIEERLDRQIRIAGWDQIALSSSRVCILGDDDLLASLFALSASALGINDLVMLAPMLDEALIEAARKINPNFSLTFIEGSFTHPALSDLFQGSRVVVDLSAFGLANKLAIEKAYRDGLPVIRALRFQEGTNAAGVKVFSYMRGREWDELRSLISSNNLPEKHVDDGVFDTIAVGIALEEVKNILMGRQAASEVISYTTQQTAPAAKSPRVLVVGAGALGNFVGLGLAFSKISNITFMDPDIIEIANLNRQVFFYEAIGRGKAKTLAKRLNEIFGTDAKFHSDYFGAETDISEFDVVFDCVDNFETRILLSEKCREYGKILISGGTSATAGQVIVYDPAANEKTPAELLGLYEIIKERKSEPAERDRQSCRYTPDPSVIMTNQIIGGIMVDTYRMALAGNSPGNIFYDSENEEKVLK